MLYVADTYNNKLKRLDPPTKVAATFPAAARRGLEDGDAGDGSLLASRRASRVADGVLYVADTNNHALRVVDLQGRRRRSCARSSIVD